MNRSSILAAALVIFLAGAAIGGVVARTYAPKVVTRTRVTPSLPISLERRMEYVAKLDKELQLTPEQRKRIEGIIESSQERIKTIWQRFEPELKEEYRRTRREISTVLTPEQQEKMKRWRKERDGGNGHPKEKSGKQ